MVHVKRSYCVTLSHIFDIGLFCQSIKHDVYTDWNIQLSFMASLTYQMELIEKSCVLSKK